MRSVAVQDFDLARCRLFAAAHLPSYAIGDQASGVGCDDVHERPKRHDLIRGIARQGAERVVDDDRPLRAPDDETNAQLAQDLRQEAVPPWHVVNLRRPLRHRLWISAGGWDGGHYMAREGESSDRTRLLPSITW